MGKKKDAKVGNFELAKAMQELRRSSAASPHADRRTKRAKTRADQERKAVEDSE